MIVTTFRLPFVTFRKENGSVGRTESRDEWARSLAHIVSQSGGQWVGWPGLALQKGQPVPDPEQGDSSPTARLSGAQAYPVFLSQGQRDLAYSGHCKSGLWPLFHSMADRAVFDEDHWEEYRRVNKTFAEATLDALRSALSKNPEDDLDPRGGEHAKKHVNRERFKKIHGFIHRSSDPSQSGRGIFWSN